MEQNNADYPCHPIRKPVVPVYKPPIVPCVITEGTHSGEIVATANVAQKPETLRELFAAIIKTIKGYLKRS